VRVLMLMQTIDLSRRTAWLLVFPGGRDGDDGGGFGGYWDFYQ
jgi:hypothetical protein